MEPVRKSLKPNNNIGEFFYPSIVIVSHPPAPLSEPVFRWLDDTDTSGYSNNAIQYTTLT